MALRPLWHDLRLADFVTLANAFVGLWAIVVAAAGDLHLAATLILVGILLDGLDGAVARLTGSGPLGATLDALSDVVTFAAAPAVVIAQAGQTSWPSFIVALFFMAAVLLRLARFEVQRESGDASHFYGISSPSGAILVGSTILLGLPLWTTLASAALSGILMLTRFHYPKLRGWLGIVAVLLIGASISTTFTPILGIEAVWAMAAFMVFYILAGPMYVRRFHGQA